MNKPLLVFRYCYCIQVVRKQLKLGKVDKTVEGVFVVTSFKEQLEVWKHLGHIRKERQSN